ncbi:right-handed parallel beta-helix repeat-containing protein [Bacillus marasmi]|uniref:right-handed parallel beta-helix repeat-containing protein n=1 Tax=Bacillus marasmi TaxID=1926279 RepID=UPI0011C7DC23|nr:right-handed parallel beta-helix repeat-containing protein [Bacillus marasmi]
MQLFQRMISLFILLYIAFGFTSVAAEENLQDLINHSQDGDTVELPSGTYTGPIVINKAITVTGQNKVTIKSDGESPAIIIKNKGATVQNLSVENKNSDYAIFISGREHTLQNVTVKTALIGVRLNEASNIKVRNVKVEGYAGASEVGNGIDLYRSINNEIADNTVQDIRDGIYVEYSNANQIHGNTITRSRYGLHFMYTEDNVVRNNTFINNHTGSMIMVSYNELYENNKLLENRQNVNSQGLYLYDVHDSKFQNNLIKDNRIGIMIDNCFTNLITKNDVQGNALGIIFKQSTDNDITNNDFKINATTILTYGDGSNQNNLAKNYWDNQQGLDVNGDDLSDLKVVADPYFMEITDKNSAFGLLFQSPGMMLMEKLFKSDEATLIKDLSPTMEPNIEQASSSGLNMGIMYISILFILASIILFSLGRKKLQ